MESNPVEEFHEFDVMEGPEDALDEFDSHNGEYEIKHLAVEPSKSKEEAEKTTIRLLAVSEAVDAFAGETMKKTVVGLGFFFWEDDVWRF
ncbi:hypothetical protein HanLR1_Chr10g0346291 [Helianthus annuus]|nr:hypothetical protein HanLR1_Chr10g0346291 [Helianthus annuus]